MRRSGCCLPLTVYTKKNTHAQRTVDLPERSIGWRSGRHVFVLVGSNPTVDICFFVVFDLIFFPFVFFTPAVSTTAQGSNKLPVDPHSFAALSSPPLLSTAFLCHVFQTTSLKITIKIFCVWN